MKSKRHFARWRAFACLLTMCSLTMFPPTARAYVFASNIQLGGTSSNLMTQAGETVAINYLLNQHADAGVTVSVFSGTNVLWTTNVTGSGTNRGLNSVMWNGKNAAGQDASNGLWHVKVTPASAGRTNWWKVPMVDNGLLAHNGDGYSYAPWGIAVNNNTNSPYFGRVFVCNSADSFAPEIEAEAGDFKGIAKYNADGSYAADGSHGTGGWNWNPSNDDSLQSPSKIEVGADDRVYVLDQLHKATVLSFDQQITSNASPTLALNNDALFQPTPSSFGGLLATGSGTNRALLLSDLSAPNGLGVRRWQLSAGGTASTNDMGTSVVAAGSGSTLNVSASDVAQDAAGRIFTVQSLANGIPYPRVLSFPAYQGSPLSNAQWTVFGSFDNKGLIDAMGVAAALHTNFLAVVCREDTGFPIVIFEYTSTNASELTVENDGLNSGSFHEYTDVAWDRAGNLYVTDWGEFRWRVFSPPGANAFPTDSIQTIKVGPYVSPSLAAVSWKTNQLSVRLSGEIGVRYAIETSTNLMTWSGVATNAAQATTNLWSIPAPLPKAYFRARVVP